MNDLKTTKALVHSILVQDEKARNNDSYLYFRVINTIADRADIDLNAIPVTDFLLNKSRYPFPPFETVRRNRQILQAKFPDLAACKEVEEVRAENEQVVRDFVRGERNESKFA